MISTTKIRINDKSYEGTSIKTEKSSILMIQGATGFLGCGYFDIKTADRLDEIVAIVRGVKTFDDMLDAKVTDISARAKSIGVIEGMSGRKALEKMH